MRSGKRKSQQDIKEDINGEAIIVDLIKDSDVGGEDQGPCSLAMPRGCVGCVVCRTRSVFALVLGG